MVAPGLATWSAAGPARLVKEVTNHLVAVSGNTNPQASLHHRRDHSRAGIGLSAAWRSLNRQHTPIERKRQTQRGG
jgi:hypothetical protein